MRVALALMAFVIIAVSAKPSEARRRYEGGEWRSARHCRCERYFDQHQPHYRASRRYVPSESYYRY
jgi:hypothetical protein